jgi:hypothetical protein
MRQAALIKQQQFALLVFERQNTGLTRLRLLGCYRHLMPLVRIDIRISISMSFQLGIDKQILET